MPAIEIVIDLPFLAGEINDAHRQVAYHARGMLLEAKRAGDALLAAKAKVKHGEFKAWVEAHCRCSYRSAAEYMQVAKHAKNADLRTFDGGVRAFLEAHAKPRPAPSITFPALEAQEAERVLKINDRAERGLGAETIVASAKLASIAADHGMTVEALLERSKAMCPDREKSPGQATNDACAREAEAALRRKREEMERAIAQTDECVARLTRLLQRRSELGAHFSLMTKSELVEALVDLTLTVEGV